MRQHRVTVLAVGVSILVSLAGCVADSTKSASDSPASSPIASAQGEPAPPAAPSSASEATGGAAGSETGGSAEAAPTLTFTQAVHFVAADGSDLVTEAETYQVDAADSHLTLRAEGRAPLVLDATPTTHREEIAAPLAVLVPGDDPDVLHVVLLLANGQALDAAGSLSGTRPRGKSRQVSAYNLDLAVQGLVVQAPIVTVIDLNGRWTAGSTQSAAISAAGTALTIDMSAWGRPAANGSIVNGSTIKATFPDDASYTGILQPPNTIRWSNGSAWAKVAQPAPTTGGNAPPEKAPTTGGNALPDRYTAPTANLTAVANALKLRHKSLTTVFTIQPGLQVTRLVEISIGFYSATGHDRITQTLGVERGNRFLYNDPEGDGRPRQIRADIALRELQPGGQFFTFSRQVDLDPLYDVRLSPLRFQLQDRCDLLGDAEITLHWYAPDNIEHSRSFNTSQFDFTYINEFAWNRGEISRAANLHLTSVWFSEHDPESIRFCPTGHHPNPNNLVPGSTRTITGHLTDACPDNPLSLTCSANVVWTITYTLRLYPSL
jgi:hypothetical protein